MQRRCPHQKTQTNHYFKLCTINLCLCSLMWAFLLGAHIFSSALKDVIFEAACSHPRPSTY